MKFCWNNPVCRVLPISADGDEILKTGERKPLRAHYVLLFRAANKHNATCQNFVKSQNRFCLPQPIPTPLNTYKSAFYEITSLPVAQKWMTSQIVTWIFSPVFINKHSNAFRMHLNGVSESNHWKTWQMIKFTNMKVC